MPNILRGELAATYEVSKKTKVGREIHNQFSTGDLISFELREQMSQGIRILVFRACRGLMGTVGPGLDSEIWGSHGERSPDNLLF